MTLVVNNDGVGISQLLTPSGTSDDTASLQIRDSLDFPHSGVFKALYSTATGNYALRNGAAGSMGFNFTYAGGTSPTVAVGAGKIFRDGEYVSISALSAHALTRPTSGSFYHLVVVKADNSMDVRISTAIDDIPEMTDGDISIGIIKTAYDANTGTASLPTQFFTSYKTDNNLSIGYVSSNAYTPTMDVYGDGTRTVFKNKIANADIRFILADNTSDEKFEILSDDDSDGDEGDTTVFSIDGLGATTIAGTTTLSTIAEVGSDTDKFLMSDSGIIKFATGANVRSYIGAGTSSVGALNDLSDVSYSSGDLTITSLDKITYANGGNAELLVAATAHNVAGKSLSISSGTTTAGTTNDIAGGSLTIKGGQGKGTGAGGDIIFQTANAAGGSASSLNALATALTLSDDLSATFTGGITSTTVSNTLGATSFNDANVTNVGDIALDSISSDASLVTINAPSEVANGASGGATALLIDNDDTDEIALHIEAANIDADVIQIDADALTDAKVIDITADALTTGSVLYIDDDSANTGTRSTTAIIQNNVAATGATALTVQSDGGNTGMTIDKNAAGDAGQNATALHIDFDRTVAEGSTNAHNDIGINLDVNSASLGTSSLMGMDIDVVGAGTGTSTATGIDVTVGSADTNIAVKTTGGSVQIGEISAAAGDTAAYGQLWVKSDTPNNLYFTDDAGNDRKLSEEVFIISLSDEATDLTAATGKASFNMPFAMTLTSVKATVNTAPTGATITVDINEAGSTILTTKLTIDASELTSTSAATAAVIGGAGPVLADDALITFDIDQIGSSAAGKGLKVTLYGYRS